MKKNKKVLILVSNGVEDVEFSLINDVLNRSSIDVEIANVKDENKIRTSYGLIIETNLWLSKIIFDLDKFDAVYIPGGPGVKNIDESNNIDEVLKHFFIEKKIVAAMCAAPIILAKRGYLKDKKAICYNGKYEREILESNGAIVENKNCLWGDSCEVVEDDNLITGLQMESSLPFAIRFVAKLKRW